MFPGDSYAVMEDDPQQPSTVLPIAAPNGSHVNTNMTDNNTTTATNGSPASPIPSMDSPRRADFQSHSRAFSMVTGSSLPSRPNRLSVQFPTQGSRINSPVIGSVTSPRERSDSPPEGSTDASEPLDGNFLHAIATSERKVLELKEELQRAQANLDKLKRQWAKHEAHKKREDIKHITKLQPLQTSLPARDREDDADGSNAWMQQEMERRKALMSTGKTSSRTVFPGQRHTRTLSLLSPAKDVPETAPLVPQPRPPRRESLKNPARNSTDEGVVQDKRPTLAARTSTATDRSNPAVSWRHPDVIVPDKSIDQEMLLRTGKELATNLKDGLWTFWEDLRQATVGEDTTPAAPPRRKSSTQTLGTARKKASKGSLRPSSRSSSVASKTSTERPNPSPARNAPPSAALPDLADPMFWTSNQEAKAAPTKKAASKHAKSPSIKRLSMASNEPWDTWDDSSPVASRSGSSVTSESNTLPSTVSGSPQTSTSTNCDLHDAPKKDPIPWPVLRKTSANGLGTLRRTASNLMKEWETSLRPSPEEEYTGSDDFLGASSEALALGAKAKSP